MSAEPVPFAFAFAAAAPFTFGVWGMFWLDAANSMATLAFPSHLAHAFCFKRDVAWAVCSVTWADPNLREYPNTHQHQDS